MHANVARGDESGAPSGAAGSSNARSYKPRLLILTPDFPPASGGIQVMSHRLAAGMEGFETLLVALDGPGAGRFDALSPLAIRRVRTGPVRGGARMGLLDAASLRAGVRFRPAVTLNMHIVTSPASAAISALLGARSAQYFHAQEIASKPRLSAFAARRADVVIAVSEYCRELIGVTGAPLDRLTTIPPGVDVPPVVARGSCEHPTILTISRLRDTYKGHDVLIDALASVRETLPDASLVVIGDGPLRGALEQRARSLGLCAAVSFLGAVSDEARDKWLRRADVFAMPSRLPGTGRAGDGFGIVYLEAAAHGMPVVAGNVARRARRGRRRRDGAARRPHRRGSCGACADRAARRPRTRASHGSGRRRARAALRVAAHRGARGSGAGGPGERLVACARS